MTVDRTHAGAIQRCTIRIHEGKGVDLGSTGGIGTRSWEGSLHPPSRQATRTSVDHHHPIRSSPTPVVPAGMWLTSRMGRGGPQNMESPATRPAVRSNLLERSESEPRLA